MYGYGAIILSPKNITFYFQPKRKKRPKRPCPFCFKFMAKLTNHLISCHRTDPEVGSAMLLKGEERHKAFDTFKKQGIKIENRKRLAAGRTDLIRERNRENNCKALKICPLCDGFYSSGYLSEHKKKCAVEPLDRYLKNLSLTSLTASKSSEDPEFKRVVLDSFREGQTKNICNVDWMIKTVGLHQYRRRGVKKTAMTDMRRLAHLLTHFRAVAEPRGFKVEGKDLFDRTYYHLLVEAIHNYAHSGGKPKHNLLIAVAYLIRSAAEITRAENLINKDDGIANEITLFLQILRSKWQLLTKTSLDAQYLRSQEILRRPVALPLQEDLRTLKTHILSDINRLLANIDRHWSSMEFTLLRDLVATRLTLFNVRRGGEATRLTLTEYLDAEKDSWINPQFASNLDAADKLLVGSYKLAYMRGKRARLVPILIPEDVIAGIRKLVKLRKQMEVPKDNQYVFAALRGSTEAAYGNTCMQRVCVDAGISEVDRVVGGKHRVSLFL